MLLLSSIDDLLGRVALLVELISRDEDFVVDTQTRREAEEHFEDEAMKALIEMEYGEDARS